jgi:hypothetical protein
MTGPADTRAPRHGRLFAACLAALAACLVAALAPAPPTRAARGRTLRVMSYNVHVGIGMDKKIDLGRVAEVIRRERPDLVGLQEVDRGVERTGRVDQVAELARLTGMRYAFAPNLSYQGGWYGVAILSRLPQLSVEHARVRHRREAERRGDLRADVQLRHHAPRPPARRQPALRDRATAARRLRRAGAARRRGRLQRRARRAEL